MATLFGFIAPSQSALDFPVALTERYRPHSIDSFIGLATLDLGGTQVADVTPLAALTSLTTLYLWNTQVADVTPLAALTSLIIYR